MTRNGQHDPVEAPEQGIGHRHSTTDLMDRQRRVLSALNEPFDTEADVEDWLVNAMQAAAGELSEAAKFILGNHDMTQLHMPYFLGDRVVEVEDDDGEDTNTIDVSKRFRMRLKRALLMEFTSSLRRMTFRDNPEEQNRSPGSAMGGYKGDTYGDDVDTAQLR